MNFGFFGGKDSRGSDGINLDFSNNERLGCLGFDTHDSYLLKSLIFKI